MATTTLPIAGQEYSRLKGQPGYDVIQNPAFDSRILNIPMRQVSSSGGGTKDSTLYRGAIISHDQTAGLKYKVNFLYNPSTINESRSLDLDNQPLPQYARDPNDTAQWVGMINTTVSFSLLFDRTFELWDSKYNGTDVGTYGVQVDTNAFYNLTGINYKQKVAGVHGGKAYNMVVQGPMKMVPADLYFGYGSPGGLHYLGVIQSMGITYTHFSQQMVPARCAIDVNFMVLPFQEQAATN